MKKKLTILLVFAILSCFTACTDKQSQTNHSQTEQKTTSNKKKEFSLGHTKDNIYENEFIGIGFTLPENWSFFTEEQMQERNADTNIIYDMGASDTLGNSISITMEKINSSASSNASEETYIKASAESLKESLNKMGFSKIEVDTIHVDLAGEKHLAVDAVCANSQLTIYEKIVCKKVEQYMVTITIGAVVTNETDTILNQFYSLD